MLLMIELENKTNLQINKSLLDRIATSLTSKEIELIVTTEIEIKKINNQYRNINKSTDVLSFPYEDMPMSPLGSIVISANHVEQKAKELNHSIDNELSLLFIHGLLHLLGYDHEVDDGEMREEEKKVIHRFNLPKSLIVRTEGI